MDPLIGATLDRYKIVDVIGQGAYGCVYRALHSTLQTEFAVKVLFGDLGSNPTFIARFSREAQAASRIRSSHVVSVIDFATTPEGLSYLVMDYVKGGIPLDSVIRNEGPLHPLRAARLAAGVASGLAAAHALGFVHRDVKPSNVLVVRERGHDFAKLLDFGIVRQSLLEESSWASELGPDGLSRPVARLTREGKIMGTPAYMPPEQWTNSEVGPSADLYALGVVLFEMLAGERPFQGDEHEQLWRHHFYSAPPALPPSFGLESLVARLLAKTPGGRPESAQAVCDELDRIVLRLSPHESLAPNADGGSTPPAVATPRSPAQPASAPVANLAMTEALSAPGPARRRPRIWMLASAGLVTVGVASTIAIVAIGSAPGAGENRGRAAAVPIADQVAQTLGRRGLTFDDLAAVDRNRLERGKRALETEDEKGAADLLKFAARVPLTPELLVKKLDRLDGPLASRVHTLDERGARLLEERYLGFYKALKTRLDSRGYESLAQQIFAFERELATPGSPP